VQRRAQFKVKTHMGQNTLFKGIELSWGRLFLHTATWCRLPRMNRLQLGHALHKAPRGTSTARDVAIGGDGAGRTAGDGSEYIDSLFHDVLFMSVVLPSIVRVSGYREF
jgi:hypothetical protein